LCFNICTNDKTNTNEIQILFAGYQKPAKLGKFIYCRIGLPILLQPK
jgi:hypothetical protein